MSETSMACPLIPKLQEAVRELADEIEKVAQETQGALSYPLVGEKAVRLCIDAVRGITHIVRTLRTGAHPPDVLVTSAYHLVNQTERGAETLASVSLVTEAA